MRLDHLLSKEEVRVVLLLICQGQIDVKGVEQRNTEEKGGRSKTEEKTSREDPVAMRLWDTPVLIPNTMVKT